MSCTFFREERLSFKNGKGSRQAAWRLWLDCPCTWLGHSKNLPRSLPEVRVAPSSVWRQLIPGCRCVSNTASRAVIPKEIFYLTLVCPKSASPQLPRTTQITSIILWIYSSLRTSVLQPLLKTSHSLPPLSNGKPSDVQKIVLETVERRLDGAGTFHRETRPRKYFSEPITKLLQNHVQFMYDQKSVFSFYFLLKKCTFIQNVELSCHFDI